MAYLNGETIRILVDKLPAHVFDALVDEFSEIVEMEPRQCKYVHWEPITADHNEDCIANDYDYCDYDNMVKEGPYTALYPDEGLLIIE